MPNYMAWWASRCCKSTESSGAPPLDKNVGGGGEPWETKRPGMVADRSLLLLAVGILQVSLYH
jgi:hypothetical protein